MTTIKRIIAFSISVLLIFSLCACNNTDEAYIYFTLEKQPQTLDPQIAQADTELMIIRNIFEGLLRKDENGKIVPGVAERYEKKGLTYTFHLRKDAKWSNEQPITSHDFLFALRRAVDPKTKAPFSKRLINIKNAKDILSGKKKTRDLGVSAPDSHTLKITLSKEDKSFTETLTTSIAMPCSESFFNESAGKYGLEAETTLSNGSYRITKWGKTVFGIRLYRNKYYNGDFVAKNAAVFISTDKERTALEVLETNDCDLAFISPTDAQKIKAEGIKTARLQNVCWFLTVSDGFSKNLRKSLLTLASPKVYGDDLIKGYSPAKSIFPSVLNSKATTKGMPTYNLKEAKKLFANEIDSLKDKKFPENVLLYYYDDGFSHTVVTDIVGHWQNQLGAYVNIEKVSAPDLLHSQLKDQTYALSIFPITADSPQMAEYLQKFGINYTGGDLSKTQSEILKSKNIVPIMMQETVLAYSEKLENLQFTNGNGCIDFAYIVKKD